jgi:hypothetical protein
MQRLLLVVVLLAISGSAFAQTNEPNRKGKCSIDVNGSSQCKVSQQAAGKRCNASGHEPAAAREVYTRPDPASAATSGGGY